MTISLGPAGTDGEILGHCGLRRWPDSDDIEVLYALTPRIWGQGCAEDCFNHSLYEATRSTKEPFTLGDPAS